MILSHCSSKLALRQPQQLERQESRHPHRQQL
jgi:hypothetical protein